VTGAASGIGRALALELAARGCDLALADRDEAGLQQVAAEIGKIPGRKVSAHHVDVGEPGQIQDFARAAIAAHPGLNIVINSAGVALLGAFDEVNQAQMEWQINTNLGCAGAARAFLPHLRFSEAHRQPVLIFGHRPARPDCAGGKIRRARLESLRRV
jgi:NAD(P)-dependent dehydrogenase (short-subunit alcohol dehydrogenase family)